MKFKCIVALLFCGLTVSTGIAQSRSFQAGEKIECKTSYSKDEWGPCTFVEKSYDGTQPVVRDAQGFQKALPNWDWVRAAVLAPVKNPPASVNTTPEVKIGTQEQGLISQSEIISFLRANLSSTPFADPRQSQVKARLVEEIKRRGLDFHFNAVNPFFNEASQFIGMDTEITNPLHDNYGPPTKQSFLMGTWKLDIVGATTTYKKNGDLYRKEGSAASNTGRLTINADGTYVWQATTPAAIFQGKWRKATNAEMMSQGGDGVVLIGAKSGWDWIVSQLRGSTVLTGDVIYVSYINGRGLREIGSR